MQFEGQVDKQGTSRQAGGWTNRQRDRAIEMQDEKRAEHAVSWVAIRLPSEDYHYDRYDRA